MTKEEILLKIREGIAALSHDASQMCEEYEGYRLACQDVSDILDEIAKELDAPSLPSELDEAAEEYAYNNWEDNDYHTGASEGLPFDAIGHTEKCFKAGAEWMAGQGLTKEAVIGMATEEISINVSQEALDGLEVCPGDKVIVQVRKK